ncbi:MmgE/PrpD family protein [Paraburkholderia phosphatilytica]|uniref:MmgE/PrpD family protein n=1 Tax=Paraburkholderia phosphatilytica TaxID=2282883 RepID=UPI000E46BC49|nr:MmgE/PrpD family protein [Paraburkholderia phosphatilytica]
MNMNTTDSTLSIAEQLGTWIASIDEARLPAAAIDTARLLLADVTGLCIAGRAESYVRATLAATDRNGTCTAIGHAGSFSAFDAALINGTAAHGEDYDDTFEGGPVHSGAVVVPAVLAACEREGLGGDALLRGIATGAELMCRLSLVAPRAIHSAGFHPTAVIGALAAAAGVSAALRLDAQAATSALGIAGSMASGIIEYLAEGTSTKRMHAGWAAQSGIRAALMARAGFDGPRTVLEGRHGFFKAFAPSRTPDFEPALNGLGDSWIMSTIAFKPYACGTMTQPYIDCAIALAERGVQAAQIEEIVCDVGEGTVHRLWEELAVKHRPPTAYAAKFSTPFCMAVGFFDRKAGFEQFTEARIHDAQVLALAAKIRYRIDPENEYPKNFTGHLRATLADGSVHEIRQPHMRGGAHEPLSAAELNAKFIDNARYGGWDAENAEAARTWCEHVFGATTMAGAAQLRH